MCCTDNLFKDLRSRVKRLAMGRAPEVVISFLFTRTILKLLLLRRGEEIFSGEMCGSLGDVVLDPFRSGSLGFARIRSDSPGFARIRSDALGVASLALGVWYGLVGDGWGSDEKVAAFALGPREGKSASALTSCFAKIWCISHLRRIRSKFSSLYRSIFVTGQEKM